jgi:tetratricopeptide (TPR) repeat protein
MDQPKAALAAIQAALALRPEEPTYLKAAGELGSWCGDYPAARAALETLLGITPHDTVAMLAMARVSAWNGDTDRAVKEYRSYLREAPDDAAAWIEAARAESWRGNDAGAVSLLESYRVGFGESDAYRRELASVLTRAHRPQRALATLKPLLAGGAETFEIHALHALAQIEYGDERAANRAFDAASLIDAERWETSNLAIHLRNAFGSLLQPSGVGYGDSDGLRSYRLPLSASFNLAPSLRVAGGYERQELRARIGSGLERVDGGRDARLDSGWAGAEVRPWTPLVLRVQGGRQDSSVRREWTYGAGVRLRVSDELRIDYDREHSLMTISPRAVSLGLQRDVDHARVAWSPSLIFAVDLDASREALSDSNERVAVRLAPRFAVVRNQWLNLDLGGSAYQFRTELDLDNGYYDPSLYEAYVVTVLPYFKFSENHGLSLFLEAGLQRDESAGALEPGGSAAGELTLGIYRAWMLKFNASATINSRLESGAFRGVTGGVVLVRRF